MLLRNAAQGSELANASVGENDVDLSLHVSDGFVETIKIGQLGNVSLNARNVAADCLYGLVEFLLAAARNEDVGTLFDEKLCRSQSNPLCPAGNHSGLALKLLGHGRSPLLRNS